MKQSKFEKWWDGQPSLITTNEEIISRLSWNAACKSILRSIQYKNRMFEGNWQGEDIQCLMDNIKDMIEK